MKGSKKKALITGITGQDGSYLSELLLEKDYEVHGVIRRSSSFNSGRIIHLFKDIHESDVRLRLHYGDLTDGSRLEKLDEPVYTSDAVGLGALRLLEAIRNVGAVQTVRFYQASSSEMYGLVQAVPQ